MNQEKIDQINELIEATGVTIQDDYFTDIFRDGETNEELFSVMSSRGFVQYPEKEEEVFDYIIEQLTLLTQHKNQLKLKL